jgi:DNA topoisomerase-1
VKLGKTYANLEQGDDVLNIGLNRAVTLIAEKKANPGKGRRFGADPGRSLGDHPDKGGPIIVKNGRYGAYVSHDGVNATLPSDKTPETITLAEAVSLIDARIAAGGGKKKKAAPKAAKAEAAGKPAKAKKAKAAKSDDTDAKAAPKKTTARKAASKSAAAKSRSKTAGATAAEKAAEAAAAQRKRKVAH